MIQERFKEPTIIETNSGKEDATHARKYDGTTDGLEGLIVIDTLPRWNRHLPVSLRPNEEVYKHSDQTNVKDQYVKVVHGTDVKVVSIFSKQLFTWWVTTPDSIKPDENIE